MKRNFVFFLLSFIFVFTTILLGSYTYLIKNNKVLYSKVEEEKKVEKKIKKEKEKLVIDTLEKAIQHSSRINFVFLGMEDIRTDSLIFASFDPKTKTADIISIPRDTYLHREGYNEATDRKINAVYGAHGVDGVKRGIRHILGDVPIHHYVKADYDGVAKIIDSIGGVAVNIPFHMKYKDLSAKPPVYIDIPEGEQLLDGKTSINFLRYRKGSDGKGGYSDGDLGRIKAQQEFMKSFIKKVLSHRLPVVITNGIEYVETDVNLGEGLIYGRKAIGMKGKDFNFITLPGIAEFKTIKNKTLSYFFHDEKAVRELMENIYGVKK